MKIKIKRLDELAPAAAPAAAPVAGAVAPAGAPAPAPAPAPAQGQQTQTTAPTVITPNTAKAAALTIATKGIVEPALKSINWKDAAIQAALIKVLTGIKILA